MPDSGSGSYSLPFSWPADRIAGLKISSTRMQAQEQDIALALGNRLCRDGQSSPTADINWGGRKIISYGTGSVPSARNDVPSIGTVQDGGILFATATGAADAITATYVPTIIVLTDGMTLGLRAGAANATTTPTFAPNGLTAHIITAWGGAALKAGDITGAGHELVLRYRLSATRWELLNPRGSILPASSTANHMAIFSGTDGRTLADGGLAGVMPGSSTANHFALFSGTDGRTLADAGVAATAFALAPGTSVAGNLAVFSGTDGRTLADGLAPPVVVQMVMTETGAVATGTTLIPLDDTIPQNTEGDQYMSLAITPKSATNKLHIEVTACFAGSVVAFISCALFQDTTADALAASPPFNNGVANSATPVGFRHVMTAGTTSATTFKVRGGLDRTGTSTFNGASAARQYGGVIASSIRITETLT